MGVPTTYSYSQKFCVDATVLGNRPVALSRVEQQTDVILETSFSPLPHTPFILPPISPTNQATQRIKGVRSTEQDTILLNNSIKGIVYSGLDFYVDVQLEEGENNFRFETINGDSNHSRSTDIRIIYSALPPLVTAYVDSVPIETSVYISNLPFSITLGVDSDYMPVSIQYVLNAKDLLYGGPIEITEDGWYDLLFYATNSIGTQSEPRGLTIILDTIAPPIPTLDTDIIPEITNIITLPLSGTYGTDTEKVLINDVVEATLDPETNSWTASLTLEEGLNLIEVVAEDIALNKSRPASAATTLKTSPPASPTAFCDNLRTNIATARIYGDIPEDAIDIKVNGSSEYVTLRPDFSYFAVVPLEEGDNQFAITAIDAANNESLPNLVSIVMDTEPPPPVAITTHTTRTREEVIELSGTKSIDTVNISVNGDSNLIEKGRLIFPTMTTWTASIILNSGTNILSFIALDDLSNKSTATNTAIERDITPPPAPTVYNTEHQTKSQTFVIIGSKTEDTEQITINASSTGLIYPSSTTWQATVTLEPGGNLLRICAVDDLGNISEPTTYRITYFSQPPDIIVAPSPETIASATYLFTGTRSEYSLVFVNESKTGTSYPDTLAGEMWTAVAILLPGNNTIRFKAVDQIGQESEIIERQIRRIP